MYRIRIIVLGKNPGVVQDKLNIEMEHNNTNIEEYLVANVIETADIKINNNENDDEVSDSSMSSCESSQIKKMVLFIFVVGSLGNLKANILI